MSTNVHIFYWFEMDLKFIFLRKRTLRKITPLMIVEKNIFDLVSQMDENFHQNCLLFDQKMSFSSQVKIKFDFSII
jgi:hypothetical protein